MKKYIVNLPKNHQTTIHFAGAQIVLIGQSITTNESLVKAFPKLFTEQIEKSIEIVKEPEITEELYEKIDVIEPDLPIDIDPEPPIKKTASEPVVIEKKRGRKKVK